MPYVHRARKFMIFVLIAAIFSSYFPASSAVYAEDIASPQVIDSTPGNGSADVAVTASVYLLFDENIQPGGEFHRIMLKEGDEAVSSTASIAGHQLYIVPDQALRYSTSYVLQIPQDAIRDMAGNELDSAHTFSFTTVDYPLYISGTTPSDGESAYPFDQPITVTFNENIHAGADFSNIRLVKGEQNLPVTSSVYGNQLIISPVVHLSPSVTYAVYLPENAVENALSLPNVAASLSFTASSDTFEPNDTVETAYRVAVGHRYLSAISKAWEADYYVFTAPESGAVTIDVSVPDHCNYELIVSTPDQSLNLSSHHGTGQSEQLSFRVVAGEQYIIDIYDAYSSTYGVEPYTLKLSDITPIEQDTFEENDRMASAYEIYTESSYDSAIGLDGDQDYYTFTPPVSGAIAAKIIPQSGNVFEMSLVDTVTGRSLDYVITGLGTEEELAFFAQEGQAYILRVRGYPHSAGAYTLQLEAIDSSVIDTYEFNDGKPFEIEPDRSYTSYISLPSDVDHYSFVASENGVMTVDLTVPPERNYDLEVYSLWMDRRSEAAQGMPEHIEFSVTAGTEYTVIIKGAGWMMDNYGTEPYLLQLSGIGPEFMDTFEPNNIMGQAYDITAGNTYSSYVSVSEDADYYAFTSTKQATVRLDLSVPEDKDYNLMLFDPFGDVKAESHSGTGLAEQITFPAQEGQTYFFKVAGATESDYDPEPYVLHAGYILDFPQNLHVVSHAGSTAVLAWDALDEQWGSVTYDVYQDGERLTSTVANTVELTGLSGGSTAEYTVKAENGVDFMSEASQSVRLVLFGDDSTAPTKPYIHVNPNGWTDLDAVVSVSPGYDRYSGVSGSQYKIGEGGVWTDYSEALTVSAEGLTEVYARTLDRAGNIGEEASATVKIDRTAPTKPTILPSSSEWANGDVTLSIVSGEDSYSGVQKSQYKIGEGGTWTDYSEALTVSAEGLTEVYARTLDRVGNISEEASAAVKMDRTAPTRPAILLSSTEWTNEDVMLSVVSGEDSYSGVQKSQYKIGEDGAWTDYSGAVTVNVYSLTEVYARTLDRAGNISEEASAAVKMDRMAPTKPTILLSATAWTNEDVTLSIVPGGDSGSGVQKSQYKIGESGAWSDYSGTVTVSTYGLTEVYARTLDYVGNISEKATAVVKIDRTAPTKPAIMLSSTEWTNEDVMLSIVPGEDGYSGVQKSQYKIGDSGAWTDYSAALMISAEGLTEVYARTLDNAGNISEEMSATVKMDRTAPTQPTILPSSTEWTNEDVTLSIVSREDGYSGVEKSQYKIGEGGAWTDYSGTVTVSTYGLTEVYARTLDHAGNISEEAYATVRIDRTAPTQPTILPSSTEWTNGDVTLSIVSGEDGYSGVQKSQYKIGESGAWTDYSAAVTISAEGLTEVYARTLDHAGNISTETLITAKIDKTAPSAPTHLVKTGMFESGMDLSWTSSTDDVGVVNYNVLNGMDLLEQTTGTKAHMTGLPYSSIYHFTVQAVDVAGNVSDPSNEVTFMTYQHAVYDYDPAGTGRLNRIIFEDGTTMKFEYDANGNLMKTYFQP